MKTYISKHIVVLFILLAGFSYTSEAQDKIQPINLETVLQLGGANSLTIQEYKLQQNLAMANVVKAKEWWLPNIYAGIAIHQLWGNTLNGDGKVFTEVNRQSFWGGMGLNASWNFGEGIFKANAAKLRAKATVYQSVAQKNKALLQIVQAYYHFLTAQLQYNAYQQMAAQADTIAQQMGVQVAAGIRYKSDELLAKSNLNHLKIEMLNAKTEYNNKSAILTQLLNIDPTVKLIVTDSVLAPLNLVSIQTNTVSFDSVYQNRPELKGMTLLSQSLKVEKRTTTTGLLLPQLRVGTYTSYFGDVFTPINPTAEVNASLLWRIPVGRLVRKGDLKKFNAKIDLQENKIAQTKATINKEVIAARQQISITKKQLNIALEGSKLAEQAMQQSIQRQQLGTVRPLEIVQAQEIYIKLRLDYLKAVAAYNQAQYAYYVAIGNNL